MSYDPFKDMEEYGRRRDLGYYDKNSQKPLVDTSKLLFPIFSLCLKLMFALFIIGFLTEAITNNIDRQNNYDIHTPSQLSQ
jgi:hypothetical protein